MIGINADTIGGDESMIMEARSILEKKGAAYQNIYFPAESEAGKLTYSITAFPTTVVVDRNGNGSWASRSWAVSTTKPR